MSRSTKMLKDVEILNEKLRLIFNEDRILFIKVLNNENDFEIVLDIINNELLNENIKFEYKLSLRGKFVVFKEIDSKLHIVLSQSYLQSYYI